MDEAVAAIDAMSREALGESLRLVLSRWGWGGQGQGALHLGGWEGGYLGGGEVMCGEGKEGVALCLSGGGDASQVRGVMPAR